MAEPPIHFERAPVYWGISLVSPRWPLSGKTCLEGLCSRSHLQPSQSPPIHPMCMSSDGRRSYQDYLERTTQQTPHRKAPGPGIKPATSESFRLHTVFVTSHALAPILPFNVGGYRDHSNAGVTSHTHSSFEAISCQHQGHGSFDIGRAVVTSRSDGY